VTSADQCRRCHQAVRRTFLVPTRHGVVALVECRICDRGRCPVCRIVLADRAVATCPACHTRLSLPSAGSAG
jgi:hypothetical protein